MTVTVDTDSGTVVSVATTTLGDELASDHAAGATTLTVKDAVDFSEDGGWLTIGAETVYYTSAVDDEDNDTGVLTLDTATANAYLEGERVILDPPAYEKTAQVMVGDFGEAVEATVPHTLWDKIADGIRADGEGEVVTLTLEGTEFVVSDVVGSEPVIDGSYLDPTVPLDPAIVPPAPPPTPVEPTESPTPDAAGTVGAILLRLPPVVNGSPVVVDVYVSDTSPVTLDAAHLHGTAEGTTYPIRSLPAGLGGAALTPGVTYYIVARSRNTAGDVDPTPSAEVSAATRLVDVEDFAVGYLYAGEVQVDQLRGGTFALGTGTVDTVEAVGVNGERVGMSIVEGRGFYSYGAPEVAGEQGPVRVWFPIDGKPNIVSGQSEFDDMTVNRTATLNGTTTVTPGSRLVLGSGVQAPKAAPSVVANWHTVQHTGGRVGVTGWTYAGLTVGHDGNWYSVANIEGSASALDRFNPTTGAYVSGAPFLPAGYSFTGGVVYSTATGRYYLLGQVLSGFNAGDWVVMTYSNTFTQQNAAAYTLDVTSTNRVPIIGWDHVNSKPLLAYVYVDGTVRISTMTEPVSASGSLASNTWFSGYTYDFDLGYVARVTTEAGDRYIFRQTKKSGTSLGFQVFTTTATPTHQTAEEWPTANDKWVRGAWYDGTRFWSMDANGARCRYETGRAMWTSGSATREVNSTLWAGNRTVTATRTNASAVLTSTGAFLSGDAGRSITGTGIPAAATILSVDSANQVTLSASATSSGTGSVTIARTTYETNTSPKASVVMPKRSRLTVTVGAIPQGAGTATDAIGARVYVGVGTGVANGSMVRERTIIAPATAWSLDSTVAAETGAPPASNGFPASTPATFESTSGGLILKADGGGTPGTGEFRDNVRAAVKGDYAEAWSTYTATWAAATTNPTLGNGTLVGRYIQRGKTITFNIVLTVGSTTNVGSGVYTFSLPAAARDDTYVFYGFQSSPNWALIGRLGTNTAPSTSLLSLVLADTRAGMNNTNTTIANGTVLRISGTYEAA